MVRPVILSFDPKDEAENEVYSFAREYTEQLNVRSDEIKANFSKYLQPLNERAETVAEKHGRDPNDYNKGSYSLYQIAHMVLDAEILMRRVRELEKQGYHVFV